jgi:hypothetical protein
VSRRLLRYAPWQMRDYLIDRGSATVLIGALLLFQTVLAANEGLGMHWAEGIRGPERARLVLAAVFPNFALIGTVTAINGIIANDRKMGYYRFLFAQPVAPTLFYAQLFLVHGLGLLLTTVPTLALFALAAPPPIVGGVLVDVALIYVTAGGIGFLLSAVTQLDWLVLGAVWVTTVTLRENMGWLVAGPFRVFAPLVNLLPPTHRLTEAGEAIFAGGAPPAGDVLWPLGYGAAAFLLGLIVVRRRPLAP